MDPGDLTCPHCGEQYDDKLMFILHQHEHQYNLYFKCASCAAVFLKKSELENHSCESKGGDGPSVSATNLTESCNSLGHRNKDGNKPSKSARNQTKRKMINQDYPS